MDIDLLRRGVTDQAALVRLVEQCAAISDPDDGVTFEPTTISVEPIRDATEYVGTRIRLHAHLGNVRQTVQIDFGVGDAVYPEPQAINYPVLLTSNPVRLSAYPVESAIAEKFEAMVHLDLQNSRMKDFYDIWILSRTLTFSAPHYARRFVRLSIVARPACMSASPTSAGPRRSPPVAATRIANRPAPTRTLAARAKQSGLSAQILR
jgi:Nucleotidyl transferase AbiEii toxin, Type IV TA system